MACLIYIVFINHNTKKDTSKSLLRITLIFLWILQSHNCNAVGTYYPQRCSCTLLFYLWPLNVAMIFLCGIFAVQIRNKICKTAKNNPNVSTWLRLTGWDWKFTNKNLNAMILPVWTFFKRILRNWEYIHCLQKVFTWRLLYDVKLP